MKIPDNDEKAKIDDVAPVVNKIKNEPMMHLLTSRTRKIAWIQLKTNLKNKTRIQECVSVEDADYSIRYFLQPNKAKDIYSLPKQEKYILKQFYLAKMNPYFDKKDFIRVECQENITSMIGFEQKHLIVLPKIMNMCCCHMYTKKGQLKYGETLAQLLQDLKICTGCTVVAELSNKFKTLRFFLYDALRRFDSRKWHKIWNKNKRFYHRWRQKFSKYYAAWMDHEKRLGTEKMNLIFVLV